MSKTLSTKPFASLRTPSVKAIAQKRDATLKEFRELKRRNSRYITRSKAHEFRELAARSAGRDLDTIMDGWDVNHNFVQADRRFHQHQQCKSKQWKLIGGK